MVWQEQGRHGQGECRKKSGVGIVPGEGQVEYEGEDAWDTGDIPVEISKPVY